MTGVPPPVTCSSTDRSQLIAHYPHTGYLYLTTALLWHDHLRSFHLLYHSQVLFVKRTLWLWRRWESTFRLYAPIQDVPLESSPHSS